MLKLKNWEKLTVHFILLWRAMLFWAILEALKLFWNSSACSSACNINIKIIFSIFVRVEPLHFIIYSKQIGKRDSQELLMNYVDISSNRILLRCDNKIISKCRKNGVTNLYLFKKSHLLTESNGNLKHWFHLILILLHFILNFIIFLFELFKLFFVLAFKMTRKVWSMTLNWKQLN